MIVSYWLEGQAGAGTGAGTGTGTEAGLQAWVGSMLKMLKMNETETRIDNMPQICV